MKESGNEIQRTKDAGFPGRIGTDENGETLEINSHVAQGFEVVNPRLGNHGSGPFRPPAMPTRVRDGARPYWTIRPNRPQVQFHESAAPRHDAQFQRRRGELRV